MCPVGEINDQSRGDWYVAKATGGQGPKYFVDGDILERTKKEVERWRSLIVGEMIVLNMG